MKKILLTFLCMVTIQVCFSQKKDSVVGERKGFSLEPYGGLGTSESVQNGTNNLGWQGGCGVVYMFNDHWGISSGFQVQKYSTTETSRSDSGYFTAGSLGIVRETANVKATYEFTYIEMPILLRYISSHNKKFGIFAEGGLIVQCILSAREVDTSYTELVDTNNNGGGWNNGGIILPYANFFNSLPTITAKTGIINLQLHWALGFFIPLSKKCSLILSVSDNLGITNVGNSINDYYKYDIGTFYYYNQNIRPLTPASFNYGTNRSFLFNLRLNVKI